MRDRSFRLDERTIQLPRGTRVVLRTDVEGDDGFVHRAASLAVVKASVYETYTLETPSGRTLTAQRDQLKVQRADLLQELGARQWDERRLRDEVIYAAVVGSRAWGLAEPDSDEDVRGCFLAPFDDASGLWRFPDEIHDPCHEEAYWEIEKLLHQALRGDANTLETLWSPLVRVETPLGQRLRGRREAFVSINVVGSFGRYAQSQFEKMRRSEARARGLRALLHAVERGEADDPSAAAGILREELGGDERTGREELKACLRSLFDRGLLPGTGYAELAQAVALGRRGELEPEPHRPKNAYNLLRLLHSCLRWLRCGEPLIEVSGELRTTLLAIKRQELTVEAILALAERAAAEVEAAAAEARLPERPDYAAADDLLRLARREAARRHLETTGAIEPAPGRPARPVTHPLVPRLFEAPLPPDVDPGSLRRFLEPHLARGDVLWLALTGAHAYGFPSADSDLDLKGTYVLLAEDMLRLRPALDPRDDLRVFEGREYDFTTHELTPTLELLLRGNGNILERFLGPFPVVTTEAGHALAQLAADSVSRRSAHHYRGFFAGVRRAYDKEKAEGSRKPKRLLYAYRVALTGIHLLRTGELEMDVNRLAAEHGFDRVPDLVELKRTQEKGNLPRDLDDTPWLEDLDRLEIDLEAALEASPLPETPPNADAIERFPIEVRLGG